MGPRCRARRARRVRCVPDQPRCVDRLQGEGSWGDIHSLSLLSLQVTVQSLIRAVRLEGPLEVPLAGLDVQMREWLRNASTVSATASAGPSCTSPAACPRERAPYQLLNTHACDYCVMLLTQSGSGQRRRSRAPSWTARRSGTSSPSWRTRRPTRQTSTSTSTHCRRSTVGCCGFTRSQSMRAAEPS